MTMLKQERGGAGGKESPSGAGASPPFASSTTTGAGASASGAPTGVDAAMMDGILGEPGAVVDDGFDDIVGGCFCAAQSASW